MTNSTNKGYFLYIAFFLFIMIVIFFLFQTNKNTDITKTSPSMTLAQLQEQVSDTAKNIIPSIATITRTSGGGAGIVIADDGLILTAKHLVDDLSADYVVTLHDYPYRVEHIRHDPLLDLAVLKIADTPKQSTFTFIPAKFIPLDTVVTPGQFVISLGNLVAKYPNSLAFGIISAIDRTIASPFQSPGYKGYYQTDIGFVPGSSGGPLLDLSGRVIGLNTASIENIDIGFALPLSQEFIDTMIKQIRRAPHDTTIPRPDIGIQYAALTGEGSMGIRILSVDANSRAMAAGLQKNDIITKINGLAITDSFPFLYHLYRFGQESIMSVTLIRADTTKILHIGL